MALHCDNGLLHMYLQFSLVQRYAAQGNLRVCEGQGTDSMMLSTDNLLELVYFSLSAISVYFVQYTHILNANCEGQSDSQKQWT